MKLEDMKAVKWREILDEGVESVLTALFITGVMLVVLLIPLTIIMVPFALAKYLLT